MTTVTATRTIPSDPASTALLLAGPSALGFWPGVQHVDGLLSPLSAQAAIAGSARRLVVRAEPPRRTPTAYVTSFRVEAEGLPSASGELRITRHGWVGDVPTDASPDPTAAVASVRLEFSTEVDYDAAVEEAIVRGVRTFLDNVAAYASGLVGAA
ncbi:MAG: hypothetical protein QOJ32_1347 [Frankiaceae bacterium]|jgi:hypothetical protein|nr:hypothetical protein [Frankiaceae bacterium]MDQ1634538.1 hypothetical protein [Frankiaceae bacterium]MDQ1674021.1 hypothetical protein [Frankiaceae bacterium]